MAECASEVRALLPCPLCGRSLFPAYGNSSITFHCKSGHEMALGDLLRAPSAALKGGLEDLLADWARQHEALIRTVEDARKNGYPEVAKIFDRYALSLECRIRTVRAVFSQSDSSKLIQVRTPPARHGRTAD